MKKTIGKLKKGKTYKGYFLFDINAYKVYVGNKKYIVEEQYVEQLKQEKKKKVHFLLQNRMLGL